MTHKYITFISYLYSFFITLPGFHLLDFLYSVFKKKLPGTCNCFKFFISSCMEYYTLVLECNTQNLQIGKSMNNSIYGHNCK